MLGPLGAEPPLPELTREFHATLRGFAQQIMRPTGIALDTIDRPDALLDADSPFWQFREQYLELGVGLQTLDAVEPTELPLLLCIIFEELGWGDAGLASSVGAGLLPAYMAWKLGRLDLLERFPESSLGCWALTEPDHGTDSVDVGRTLIHANAREGRANCTATLTPEHVIVNGQKSAWVSNAPVADFAMLCCRLEGAAAPGQGICVFLPLDLPGVSRGRVLSKLGQRALPQGELFFDQVEVPLENLLCEPDDYGATLHMIHAEANALMGSVFTGVARAAYDLAFDYAHQRRQGGATICRHQDVARRLFHMARRVEASCALSRRVMAYRIGHAATALPVAMFAKTTATQTSFDVASDALQLFGANGLTPAYPIEKIFRDARASLIEDGCNEALAVMGGFSLLDPTRLEQVGG